MVIENLIQPLLGGALIGLAALVLLLFTGQIAGISGIVGGMRGLQPAWRASFVAALILGGLALASMSPSMFPTTPLRSVPAFMVAGLLVGIGARMGSGCTSGHGVCGIGRFSMRSILATVTFIGTGMATVYIVKTVFGGSL